MLPDVTLEAVKKSIAFKEDIRVIRTSVNHPEISLIIQPIEKNKVKTFEGLYFVLDKVINSSEKGNLHALSDILKTIIYFESKAVINKALACIRGWLVQLGYDIKAVSLATKSYHSTTADKDKELVMLEFQKEGQQSVHRILLATDSLGIGIDLPDISRVVQWKLPKQRDDALEIMWQRFGRVARGPEKAGEAILLAEQWFWGPRETRKQGFKANKVSVSDIEDSD